MPKTVAARSPQTIKRAAPAFLLLILCSVCFGQTTPAPTPPPDAPLTDREKSMMELIRQLQERVTKLEAAGVTTTPAPTTAAVPKPAATPMPDIPRDSETGVAAPVRASQDAADAPVDTADDDENSRWGRYTPNLGFKLVNTEYGDLNLSIYTYVRYLNQLGLDSSYVDAFGNVKTVQNRQDVQIQKLQFKFLGWILNPKLRYFLYAWTSNANQGLGAQTVLAGNLNYMINKHLTIGGGIKSLPGTRSVEGNFPFWTNVDSRHIADEFFRPSYTSGIWATGRIVKDLEYQVMLGNNMSTLGVPASRLDKGLNTFASALVWFPTGDFNKGFSGQGWGDFENHDKFSTRVGFHFTRSDENKESQPSSEQFENTQLRLSDGTVIFTPDIFGKGVVITDARYQMTSFDSAFKYRGYSLEGEYYLRWINNFRGENVEKVPSLFDHGFQLQGTSMFIPKTLQGYVGHSRVFGQYGDPWDFRFGVNFFPFKNKVVRWNTEGLYLHKSPVGYTSVAYPVGGRGWVFSSTVELAF
ncbi:MAG TPA: hypothetical protein VJV05_06060 [Pyrinomonadaceae bacterium]|nr:hypothetical protein [Pyrinomonadaceae bacterium]